MLAAPLLAAALLAQPGADLDRCLELLEELDRSRISIDLRDASIESAVAEIAAASKRPVRADWDALVALGVRPDDHVDLRVTDAPVSTALSALALQLGPEYERAIFDVGGDQVVLTTVNAATAMRLTGLYDLRKLLGDEVATDALREALEAREAPPAPAPPDGAAPTKATPPALLKPPGGEQHPPDGAKPDGGTADGVDPATRSRAARFVSMLIEHVDPEGWVVAGGSRARIDERDGVLFVTATPRVHRQIRSILDGLAALSPRAVDLRAVLVRTTPERLELLRRRHAPASAALVRALVGGDGAEILWRGGGPVRLGETLTTKMEATAPATEHLRLSMTPSLDAPSAAALVAIDVDLKFGQGATLETASKASVPLPDGGVIIEFGGLGGSGAILVLAIEVVAAG